MYLLIDNYDSFTFNLFQLFAESGVNVTVRRNDQITLSQIRDLAPEKIIISPGPKTPEKAGISKKVIENFKSEIPILGVCLGSQCIAEVCGGKTLSVGKIVHGLTSRIYHKNTKLFKGVKNPFSGARYHSLISGDLPDELKITANTEEKIPMALEHISYPLMGLQFHPESFLTAEGKKIIRNFIRL